MKTCQPRVGRSVLNVLDIFCTRKDVLAALTVVTINASNPDNWPLLLGYRSYRNCGSIHYDQLYSVKLLFSCAILLKTISLAIRWIISAKFAQNSTNRSNCFDVDNVALIMVLGPQF